jgi:type II secretory pathway predicted ATPase ExeA
MIQSHFGITRAPFTLEEQPLLQPQQDILECLRVHSHQRGFCIIAGSPGTGKTVLRKAFAQSELLAKLALAVNEDLRSRVSYSALLYPLLPEHIEAFILRELDRCGLAHSRIDTAAIHLISSSSRGILRHAVNLTTAALIQAVRTQNTTVNTDHVNTALMQPHWREHQHWITATNHE